jgi:peptide/nickel transport system substrate-binding protein
LSDPNVTVLEVRASQHRQIHMRTDREPFTDKRVRQALALLINRQALVDGLFDGKADLGNDSPFAPVFPSTDTSVAQREQDVDQAMQLLADAGQEGGFQVELNTWDGFEIPQLAQLVQDAAAEAGIRIRLNITDPGTYYGDAVYGKSPWLDSTFGITDYGHRGVPNVLLTAPLTSKGPWNSAHFKNPQYDDLVAQYAAALDVETQRGVARQIQELLLDETPLIIPYFYFHLGAMRKNVAGVEVTGMGHFDVNRAGFTS